MRKSGNKYHCFNLMFSPFFHFPSLYLSLPLPSSLSLSSSLSFLLFTYLSILLSPFLPSSSLHVCLQDPPQDPKRLSWPPLCPPISVLPPFFFHSPSQYLCMPLSLSLSYHPSIHQSTQPPTHPLIHPCIFRSFVRSSVLLSLCSSLPFSLCFPSFHHPFLLL